MFPNNGHTATRLTAAGNIFWHFSRAEWHGLFIVILWRWCVGQGGRRARWALVKKMWHTQWLTPSVCPITLIHTWHLLFSESSQYRKVMWLHSTTLQFTPITNDMWPLHPIKSQTHMPHGWRLRKSQILAMQDYCAMIAHKHTHTLKNLTAGSVLS